MSYKPNYCYDDGQTPIVFQQGADGFNGSDPDSGYPDLNKEQLANRSNGAEKSGDSAKAQKLPHIVEFVSYGRVHYYPKSLYADIAPVWRERLIEEARHLSASIVGSFRLYQSFLLGATDEEDTDFKKGLGAIFHETSRIVGGASRPFDPNEYTKLLSRIKLIEWFGDDYTYADLHKAGVEMERIRHRQRYLDGKFAAYRNQVIEGAETTLEGLKTTEATAFEVLDVYAQVKGVGNPALTAKYRIAVLLVRTAARSTGESLADSKVVKILETTLDTLAEGIPPILVDLLMGKKISPYLEKNTMKEKIKKVVELYVKLHLKLVSDSVVMVYRSGTGSLTEAWIRKRAKGYLVDVIKDFVLIFVDVKSDVAEKWVGLAVKKVVEIIFAFVKHVSEVSKKTKQDEVDVAIDLLADVLGKILVYVPLELIFGDAPESKEVRRLGEPNYKLRAGENSSNFAHGPSGVMKNLYQKPVMDRVYLQKGLQGSGTAVEPELKDIKAVNPVQVRPAENSQPLLV